MRDKLIELIRESTNYHTEAKERWILDGKKTEEPRITGSIADHLLANGVIVLPCKVGDMVYYRTFGKKAEGDSDIQPHEVIDILTYVVTHGRASCSHIPARQIGKSVFLTREEAEAALEEVDNG